jgi:hypothetical protein
MEGKCGDMRRWLSKRDRSVVSNCPAFLYFGRSFMPCMSCHPCLVFWRPRKTWTRQFAFNNISSCSSCATKTDV